MLSQLSVVCCEADGLLLLFVWMFMEDLLYARVTTARPTAYARSEANVEQIVYGLSTQAVRIFIFFIDRVTSDKFSCKELRERLGIDNIALVLQQNRLHWYGHVLRKEDNDWVKKCMEYEVSRESKTKRKTKEDLERGSQRGLSSM